MAGLLDFQMPGLDTPEGQGLLATAFSLMRAQKYPGQRGLAGALGEAGQAGMQTLNSSRDQMQRRKYLDAQMQAQQMQLEAAQKAQAEKTRVEAAVRNQFSPMDAQGALAGGGGPTIANAQKIGQMPNVDPLRALREGGPRALEQVMSIQSALNPKPTYGTVAPNSTIVEYGPNGPKTVMTAPGAPEKDDGVIRQLRAIYGEGTPAYQAALQRLGAKVTTHQPATTVNVSPDKSIWGGIGGDIAGIFSEGRKHAQTAQETLGTLQELKAVYSRGISAGAGAGMRLEAMKALNQLGANIDPARVADTDYFNSVTKSMVLSSIKSLGANPSNADVRFIEQTLPTLDRDPMAIPKIINYLEQKAVQKIKSFNTIADSITSSPQGANIPFPIRVEMPKTDGAALPNSDWSARAAAELARRKGGNNGRR